VSTIQPQEQIANGAEVFGADGGKVGTVAAVYPGYIVVEKGFFFPTDYFVPRSAVASADGGQVYLHFSKDAALDRGWDVIPADLETATIADAGVSAAAPTADTTRGELAGSTQILGEEEVRIPVIEEELTATVRPQEAGALRIEKHVITEEQTLDVPVTEERLRIERRVVDRPIGAGESETFDDVVIEVPLRTEAVDVQKQARVTEEIVISKEAVERTERVSDTVRKEQVHIDEDEVIDPALIEAPDATKGDSSRAI
jgi:uncharacterized protein (TIGR02271 family)